LPGRVGAYSSSSASVTSPHPPMSDPARDDPRRTRSSGRQYGP
jgi:hypothetical protein